MKFKNAHFEFIPASLGAIIFLIPTFKHILSSNFDINLLNLPGYYLMLLAYVLILVSMFLKKSLIFGLGGILGLFLAARSSYDVWAGNKICPVSDSIPLSYVSLLLLAVILILKIIKNRQSN